jgi:hypothetical protein
MKNGRRLKREVRVWATALNKKMRLQQQGWLCRNRFDNLSSPEGDESWSD